MNNLKTKVDKVDICKLKAVPLDFNNLSDVVDNEAVLNAEFNTLKRKVNNLEKTLIHTN